MKHFITIIISFLLSINFSSADKIRQFPFVFDYQSSSRLRVESPGLELNRQFADIVFNSESKNLIIDNFPVSPVKFASVSLLQLRPIIDSLSQWFIVRNKASEQFSPPVILSYEGIIDEEPQSKIFLTYCNGFLFCFVKHEDGTTYSIQPEINNDFNIQKHRIALDELLSESSMVCLTRELENIKLESKKQQFENKELSPSKLLEIKVACEATSEFYGLFANVDKATAYIVSVLAHSSKLFEDNMNVRFKISYTLIWQNPALDPYRSENLLSDKLWSMPTLWKNKPVDRAITVLFASLAAQQGGVSVAGIAMGGIPGKGNLCRVDEGYCVLGIKGGVIFPTVDYSWDVNVAAHEIGHLFGSPHTHSCYWSPQIDTCVTQSANQIYDACVENGNPVPRPGTIMSYCHLTNSSHSVELHFHPREIPLMRQAALRAVCAYEVPLPYISLLSPLGGVSYKSGDIIPIRWTSSNVKTISIKYSVNNGSSWSNIADYIDASDSIYYWQTPVMNVPSILILIHASSDMTVNDKSYVPFSILIPLLTLNNPVDGDEYPQKSTINLNWNSVFTDSVKIEFSSDNGNSWELISETYFINSFIWNVPQIVSNDCYIKLTSKNNLNLFSQSGKFKIGIPTARIIFPSTGDKLCSGQSYQIKWESDYVRTCYLQYSVDAGINWRKVTLVPIDAKQKYYNWIIPEKITDNAQMRILTKTSEMKELDITKGNFSIIDCSNSVKEYNHESYKISFTPNPANDYLNINFLSQTSSLPGKINIEIFGLTGNLVLNQKFEPASEKAEYRLSVADLPNGNYFLRMTIDKDMITSGITILR